MLAFFENPLVREDLIAGCDLQEQKYALIKLSATFTVIFLFEYS